MLLLMKPSGVDVISNTSFHSSDNTKKMLTRQSTKIKETALTLPMIVLNVESH